MWVTASNLINSSDHWDIIQALASKKGSVFCPFDFECLIKWKKFI